LVENRLQFGSGLLPPYGFSFGEAPMVGLLLDANAFLLRILIPL
jgi:hypothetical protein